MDTLEGTGGVFAAVLAESVLGFLEAEAEVGGDWDGVGVFPFPSPLVGAMSPTSEV